MITIDFVWIILIASYTTHSLILFEQLKLIQKWIDSCFTVNGLERGSCGPTY